MQRNTKVRPLRFYISTYLSLTAAERNFNWDEFGNFMNGGGYDEIEGVALGQPDAGEVENVLDEGILESQQGHNVSLPVLKDRLQCS